MRSVRSLRKLGLLVALFASAYGSALAAADEQSASAMGRASFYGDPGVPDISGLWMGTTMGVPGQGAISNSGGTADGRPPVFYTPWPLPYTPAYQKIYDERVEARKKGRALGDIGSKCLPFGMPNMITSQHYPEEIIQTPGQITFYFFGTFPVTIWTDGRPHPKDLVPSYNGHSIGHWVGDTLHIETVGILGTTPFDSNLDPHSGKLRIEWTVRHVAKDILHIDMVFYDEDALTEPVAMTNIAQRKTSQTWAVLDDQSCFENNQDVPPPAKLDGFVKF